MSKKQKNKPIDLSKAKILHDFVMVLPLIVEEASGGIKRPQQYEDKPEYGKVILCGADCSSVSIGDVVLFQKYSTERVRDPQSGEDYLLLKEADIRCII